MDKTRIKLAVYVDLDSTPGPFHSADSARNAVSNILHPRVGHYNPNVSIESYDINKSVVTREVFGPINRNWINDRWANELFLKGTQIYMNNRLQVKGHVFLNEVLDALGMERSSDGAICGWLKGSKVEIKIAEVKEDGTLMLEIFVDGVMYNKI